MYSKSNQIYAMNIDIYYYHLGCHGGRYSRTVWMQDRYVNAAKGRKTMVTPAPLSDITLTITITLTTVSRKPYGN